MIIKDRILILKKWVARHKECSTHPDLRGIFCIFYQAKEVPSPIYSGQEGFFFAREEVLLLLILRKSTSIQ